MTLDVEFCRNHFPALGADFALFDNAGGSVTARPVIERVTEYMARYQVQLGASYRLSEEAGRLVEDGRAAAARLVGADPDEIVLGPSTTMNVLVLAQALRPLWREGDEIVVTDLDHEANIGAWRRLADTGIVIKEWHFDRESATLRREDLAPLLTERTRLVCFTHCANVVGAIHDVAAITRMVHDAGAQVCVDGVAFAPHRRVDVRALDVDYYLTSLYKVYGPHLGLLYGKRGHLRTARGVNHFFIGEDQVPYKLQPGNVIHELTAGIPGIIDYLVAVADQHGDPEQHGVAGDVADPARVPAALDRSFELFAAHEQALAAPLLGFLRDHPRTRIIGPAGADAAVRAPTIAFEVDGMHASEIPAALDPRGVAVRFGDFYAPRAIERLGLAERGGIVRVSMVHYNTAEEVDRLLDGLQTALAS